MNLASLTAIIGLHLFILLLVLWLAFDSVHRHPRRTVDLIREQRNEDLRWHRESLLAHMRLEQATRQRS